MKNFCKFFYFLPGIFLNWNVYIYINEQNFGEIPSTGYFVTGVETDSLPVSL